MALGYQIKKYRLAAGMTLDELSARCGVPAGTIGAMERRDSTASKFARQIAQGLNLTFDQLIDESREYGELQTLNISDKVANTGLLDEKNIIVIARFDTGGAMGSGLILYDQPGVIEQLRVSDEWLRKNIPQYTSVDNLCLVTGFGDSMRPTYNPGDPLIVDLGIKEVKIDSVFFFRVGNEGFVKRLQRIPGKGLVAKSDNPLYESWPILADMDFEIFGRVLKAWESKDF